MFTGIVEHVGTVVAVTPRGKVVQLTIDCGPIVAGARLGDSIAINGTDLTVTTRAGASLRFEMVQETASITNLGQLRPGSRVNLERALRADGRYDGHIVQGHVDGTAAIQEWRRQQEDVRLFISCAPELAAGMVPKGSITVDGVSLSLVAVGPDLFSVALILSWVSPTIRGERRVGDLVNVEIDLLGKYVRKYLHQIFGAPSAAPTGTGLSVARLRELGF